MTRRISEADIWTRRACDLNKPEEPRPLQLLSPFYEPVAKENKKNYWKSFNSSCFQTYLRKMQLLLCAFVACAAAELGSRWSLQQKRALVTGSCYQEFHNLAKSK